MQNHSDNHDKQSTEPATSTASSSSNTHTHTTNNNNGITNAQDQQQEPLNSCTQNDLIELIRAVKFANKDTSIRSVHKEITNVMSCNVGFEFLAHVKLDDVKKVWKKALLKSSNTTPPTQKQKQQQQGASTAMETAATGSSADVDVAAADGIIPKDGILKFYTVGNPSSSVQSLAEGYTLEAAARVAQEEAAKEQTRREELDKYVHCFLDVPADQSGTKPHQALINFNQSQSDSGKSQSKSSRSGGAGSSSKKKKKGGGGGGGKTTTNATTNTGGLIHDTSDADKRDIVKIQVAAPLPGMEHVKLPMLLYNVDRSAKTFIHPDDNDDGGGIGGYDKIRKIILEQGQQGVLSGGGTKAYFYCRFTRIPGEHDIVSIDVTSGLAPSQTW